MLTGPARAHRVGIVGAGMAGLSCAARLVAAGHSVQLFDKGRGPGGRMATRRIATPLGDALFDHGAQYFTARDPGFAAVVTDWEQRGLAARWPAAGDDAWVGQPSMNSVVKDMAGQHDVRSGELVRGLKRTEGMWQVLTASGAHGPFDTLIVAIPSEQAAPLLALHDLALAQQAMHARSLPCWTALLAFAEPLTATADIFRGPGQICWAARNSVKPGRDGPEAWVIQASAQWSAEHVEAHQAHVLTELVRAFELEIAQPLPAIIAAQVHRWRFALSAGTGLGALWNADIRLGACGDWLLGPRVECAWLSGQALAGVIAASGGSGGATANPAAALTRL